MCMNSEAVEQLHELTTALKKEHESREDWLRHFDTPAEGNEAVETDILNVTRSEAESIFAARIAAHEARLKELGWTRTIRVTEATAEVPK